MKTKNNTIKAWCYLLPAFIILITFSLYPTFKVFLMSFYTRYNYFKHQVYEYGIGNYFLLFADDQFILSIYNTVKFVIIMVPTAIALSLFISVKLVKNNKVNSIIRSVYFLPFITSTVAVAVVFRWLFHSRVGLLNYFLSLFGIEAINWLIDPRYSLYALIIMCVWKSLGYNILILLTGLRNIPLEYYSAAKLDGASELKIFFKITLPLLFPTIFFVFITALIGAFKTFSEVYALFHNSPGPVNSCLTIVYYIYDKLINQFSYGVASSASFFLFLLILSLTLIGFLLAKIINKQIGLGSNRI